MPSLPMDEIKRPKFQNIDGGLLILAITNLSATGILVRISLFISYVRVIDLTYEYQYSVSFIHIIYSLLYELMKRRHKLNSEVVKDFG